ncbi:MAG TPA: L,D-transpeptidase family protein [Steroidobacteraceae bacterium]|nr:L,D-transpeptidase family protein [Steroidobacteraceae bacterium]
MKRLHMLVRPRSAWIGWLAAASAALACADAGAAEYVLPANGDNVIGRNSTAIAAREDTLFDIARRTGAGYEEMVAANPGVDPWLPGDGTEVLIPGRYILPDAPRKGIVVNLPEHRLYYYPPPKKGEPAVVRTYPISTGKMDWKTPIGVTQIQSKQEKPNWYPPASVLKEHEERGDPLPKVVPPGPDNPLGEYAMRLAIPGGAYLIHGTNKPAGVGMQVTHGCIRMYPEDIAELFPLVPVRTQVNLIDQTNKVGWQRGVLYVERHAPLEGTDNPADMDPSVMDQLVSAAAAGRPVEIDWALVQRTFEQATGVPVPLSVPVRAAAR